MKRNFVVLLILFFNCFCNTSNSKVPQQGDPESDVSFADASAGTNADGETKAINTFLNTSSASKTKEEKKDQTDDGFKSINFGFNIGYLGDLKKDLNYEKPLQVLKADGVKNVRVYEPFTKNLMPQPQLKTKLLTDLTDRGFQVLLSLSDYPYQKDDIQDDRSSENESRKQMLGFTNRYPPNDLSAYTSYLDGFVQNLQTSGALDHIKFEIGNEPDAKKYFWGTPDQFISIAKQTKSVLLKYKRPIFCCAFTSEFANNGSAKSQQYEAFLQDKEFFRGINVSFHFYHNSKYGFNTIKLPNVGNAAITEFNLFSYQKGSNNKKSANTNSPYFGGWMIQLLDYAYQNDIKSVYLFKLVDNADKEGSLGFFDANGDPKPSYNYFKQIYSIIKDGYKIQKDNQSIQVIGHTQRAVYSLVDNLALNGNVGAQARSAVKSATSQILKKGAWAVVNN